MAISKKINDFSDDELIELEGVMSKTLTLMLQAEAMMTALLPITALDSMHSKLVARILKVRSRIDLLQAKHDLFEQGQASLAPPTPEMINVAVNFSQKLAEIQQRQAQAQALLNLTTKALGVANHLL